MFVAGDTGRNVVRLRDVSVVRVKLFVRVSYASSVRAHNHIYGGRRREASRPHRT